VGSYFALGGLLEAPASLVDRSDAPGAATHRLPRMLTVLQGGGFTFETACLLRPVAEAFEFAYLVTEFGGQPGVEGIPPGSSYPVWSFGSKTRPSVPRSFRAFISTFVETVRACRRGRVDVVVAVGCSHAVPMLLAGRLLRTKTVYVESITRTDVLSLTGRIVYRLRLARLFIVQWPELRQRCRAASLGTIL
jgi:Oligosaccharide biosynthesis protein Alg14 like